MTVEWLLREETLYIGGLHEQDVIFWYIDFVLFTWDVKADSWNDTVGFWEETQLARGLTVQNPIKLHVENLQTFVLFVPAVLGSSSLWIS